MNGKILLAALLLGVVAIIGTFAYDSYLGSATATCGEGMTLASYSFTSDATMTANLCKLGSAETMTSYEVTSVSGEVLPSSGGQVQPTPIASTPTAVHVQLANGYTFQMGSSYFLYINTNVGTHKFTVAR